MNPEAIAATIKNASARMAEFEDSLAARKGQDYARLVSRGARLFSSLANLEKAMFVLSRTLEEPALDELFTHIVETLSKDAVAFMAAAKPREVSTDTFSSDVKIFLDEVTRTEASLKAQLNLKG